jgi:AGZA family xanthine/uracil permease-like MFS transporter
MAAEEEVFETCQECGATVYPEHLARGLAEIDWEDITEYAPAVVTAITMPLTYSIATGIGLGFITYAQAKLISGKAKEASPAVLVLAVLFAVKFAVSG